MVEVRADIYAQLMSCHRLLRATLVDGDTNEYLVKTHLLNELSDVLWRVEKLSLEHSAPFVLVGYHLTVFIRRFQ